MNRYNIISLIIAIGAMVMAVVNSGNMEKMLYLMESYQKRIHTLEANPLFSSDGEELNGSFNFTGTYDFTSATLLFPPIVEDKDGDGMDEPYTLFRCPGGWTDISHTLEEASSYTYSAMEEEEQDGNN
jgi:hypothetical protein